MGMTFNTPAERRAYEAERKARVEHKLAQRDDDRKRIAWKITMMVVDTINERIVRPGPVAEERECYDMAQEMHDLKPELTDLISQIIDVNGGVS